MQPKLVSGFAKLTRGFAKLIDQWSRDRCDYQLPLAPPSVCQHTSTATTTIDNTTSPLRHCLSPCLLFPAGIAESSAPHYCIVSQHPVRQHQLHPQPYRLFKRSQGASHVRRSTLPPRTLKPVITSQPCRYSSWIVGQPSTALSRPCDGACPNESTAQPYLRHKIRLHLVCHTT